MSNKSAITAIVLLVLVIVSGYLFDNWTEEGYDIENIKVTNCKISESSCSVDLGDSKNVKVSITPKGIPETLPLIVNVDSTGLSFDNVSVIFEGVEIDHNLPAFPLSRKDNYSFTGRALLSICLLSEMNWIAHVVLKNQNNSWKISFPFKSDRN